jgi:quinol monooxygenase YgiN
LLARYRGASLRTLEPNALRSSEVAMWAQLITMRLKPGKDDDELVAVMDLLRSAEQPGSGLLRSTTMRDQQDPTRAYTVVVFDSEESARTREQDPRREQVLQAVRQKLGELLDGAPEFVDLDVVTESVS